MRSGATGAIVRGVVLAAVCGAALVSAQPPGTPPVYDPNVIPIQRLEPPVPPASVPDTPRTPTGTTTPTGVSVSPGRGQAAVFDPPPPVLQLQVRTPSHVPVGKPVPYKVTVTNSSQAKALRVRVRMPWPDGAAALTKCEPKPDGLKDIPPQGAAPQRGPDQKVPDMGWEIGDLPPGKSQAIELTFAPAADAKKVAGTAYVSFEYGAKVETAIDKPKLAVKRTATPEVAVGDLVTVQVEVSNPGTVAVPKVKLIEFAPPNETEFRGDEKAEKVEQQEGLRGWDLGTLAPGATAVVRYQLLARRANPNLSTRSTVTADAPLEPTTADSRTKVLQPALSLQFSGTAAAAPKAPAVYTAVVRNTGTLPLTDVRLMVDVPDGLEVTKRTNGMKKDGGGRHTWTIPRLPAGEAQEFSIECKPLAGVAGKKLLKAAAGDGRGLVPPQTAEAGTEFVGRADLTWKPHFDKIAVPVGRQGTLTVRVMNQGAETDNGVRLRVTLPPEVKYIGNNGATEAKFDNAQVMFPVQKLAPGKEVEFTVTYEGKTIGPGRFVLMLEGESLGGKALTKEQEVLVER